MKVRKGPHTHKKSNYLLVVVKHFGKGFQKCGDFFFTWLGHYPTVFIRDPDTMNEIYTSPNCQEKADFYSIVTSIYKEGILALPHAKWQKHRRLLNSGFKQQVQLEYIPIINTHAKQLCEQMLPFVGQGEHHIHEVVNKTFLSLAAKTYFGKTDEMSVELPAEQYD